MTAYARGGVSVGIHAEADSPEELIAHLAGQAAAADAAGFDGVSISEHHAGFGGYVPNPLLVSDWLLDEIPRAWVATGPLLLSLRNPALVVEDVAWMNARHPGRFGLGVGPGFAPADFDALGIPLDERLRRYRAALAAVVDGLGGRAPEPLGRDMAIRASAGQVPVVSTLGGPRGAEHAGRAGASAMVDSFASVEKAAALFQRYGEAGGTGVRVLCRRIWYGAPDPKRMEVLAAGYRGIGSGAAIGGPQTDFASTEDPDDLARRLVADVTAAGADALLLRFNFPGLAQADAVAQLESVGRDVLPRLRAQLSPAP